MSPRLGKAASRTFDLLVVGGGIFGAGAAREAALNGWSVCLSERSDLGSETSSRSSKLIHGGLRYLERFELGLVAQALRERAVLHALAPHLVHPLPFLAPVCRRSRIGPWRLRAGLWMYDQLARTHTTLHRDWLGPRDVCDVEPAIDPDGLRGAGRYFDFQAFDSRLVAAVAQHAALCGAAILTRAEVGDLRGGPPDIFRATVRDVEAGGTVEIRARAVIAACGPFSDQFRERLVPGARARARLSSGAHIVLPAVMRGHALTLTARSDGRVFFIMPFEGRTLVGTTDRDYQGPVGDPPVEERDILWLIDEANAVLRDRPFRRSDVIAAFCGVRTLARDQSAHPSKTSREQLVFEEPAGVVHVIGGKLTTWRLIARELVEVAARAIRRPLDDGRHSASAPLPGGAARPPMFSNDLAATRSLPPATAERLSARFGSLAADVAREGRELGLSFDPLGPTLPESAAELAWLARHEFARTAEDALRRRLPRLLTDRVSADDLARAESVIVAHRV